MQRYSISDEISLHVFQQLESLYVNAPSKCKIRLKIVLFILKT